MTQENWLKKGLHIKETLNPKEIAKFLKILEIKFVSGTKFSKKEGFVLRGLRMYPLFFSETSSSVCVENADMTNKAWKFWNKVKKTDLVKIDISNYSAIYKHLRNFCVFGCGYFNY